MPAANEDKKKLIFDISKIYNSLKSASTAHTALSIQGFLRHEFTQKLSDLSVTHLQKIKADLIIAENVLGAEKNMLDTFVSCVTAFKIKDNDEATSAANQLQRHVYSLVNMTQEVLNGVDVIDKYHPKKKKKNWFQNIWATIFPSSSNTPSHTETFKKIQSLSTQLEHFVADSFEKNVSPYALLFDQPDYVVAVFNAMNDFLKFLLQFKKTLIEWHENERPEQFLIHAAHQIAFHAIKDLTSVDVFRRYPEHVKILLDYFSEKEKCVDVLIKFNRHLKELHKLHHLPTPISAKIEIIAKKLMQDIALLLEHQMVNPKNLHPILEQLDGVFYALEETPFNLEEVKKKILLLINLVQQNPEKNKSDLQNVRKEGRELLSLIGLNNTHPPELMNILRWHHQQALKELSEDFTNDLYELDETLDDEDKS